ncbi:hypothetical protein LWI28_028301 [Acer negundo]|uniref:Uncharacterized protein n=1 Tax=Acer negundo TaxID=4023 RepID=A0AAD5P6L8_ACENE|nr:hypothetical protein LWI28_028301 [Acer negundo]
MINNNLVDSYVADFSSALDILKSKVMETGELWIYILQVMKKLNNIFKISFYFKKDSTFGLSTLFYRQDSGDIASKYETGSDREG